MTIAVAFLCTRYCYWEIWINFYDYCVSSNTFNSESGTVFVPLCTELIGKSQTCFWMLFVNRLRSSYCFLVFQKFLQNCHFSSWTHHVCILISNLLSHINLSQLCMVKLQRLHPKLQFCKTRRCLSNSMLSFLFLSFSPASSDSSLFSFRLSC